MDAQQRYRRRCHAGNAGRLTQSHGAVLRQLLLHFMRQAPYQHVIQIHRQARILVPAIALDLCLLPFDVTMIFGLDLNLQSDIGRGRVMPVQQTDCRRIINFRPA